jgi:heme/copper-type cytochrome/quinol oxidase subunit 1
MEFESSTPERFAAAIAFGSVGFAAIGVAYVFPETPLLVFVMGMVLLGAGVTFATWNTVIHVERRARRVTKIQRILLWTTIQRYPFASFRSIKVARSKKTAVKMGSGTIYRLKLDGVPSLALPGNYDKRTVDDNAVALSQLMGVGIEGRQLRQTAGRR